MSGFERLYYRGFDLYPPVDEWLHPCRAGNSIRMQIGVSAIRGRVRDLALRIPCYVECDSHLSFAKTLIPLFPQKEIHEQKLPFFARGFLKTSCTEIVKMRIYYGSVAARHGIVIALCVERLSGNKIAVDIDRFCIIPRLWSRSSQTRHGH